MSLWPSQRLWTYGWCPNEMMVVMFIILIARLVSSTWLGTWPEIICDSSKEEKEKNLAVLVQQSHHSVVETKWTLIYFTTFNIPVSSSVNATVCGRTQTCDFTPCPFTAPHFCCAYYLENTVRLNGVLRLSAVHSSMATQPPENRLNNKWSVCI